jgi:transposase
MFPDDARKLPADALEALRRRAIAAVESGTPKSEVARMFGVSRQTISAWHRDYRLKGEEALRSRRRGRRRGDQLALSYAQQLWTIQTVTTCGPDQVGLRYGLWTHQALVELINNRFRIGLSAATARNYLIRWGVLAEFVLVGPPRDRHPDPASGTPALAGAETLWTEHTSAHRGAGMRPYSAETSLAPVGSGRGVAMLYAVSNRGAVFFLPTSDPYDGVELREFFTRLVRQRGRRVNIVQGWRPAQRVDALTTWIAQHAGQVSVRYAVETSVVGGPEPEDKEPALTAV